jgi:hypothetical protein
MLTDLEIFSNDYCNANLTPPIIITQIGVSVNNSPYVFSNIFDESFRNFINISNSLNKNAISVIKPFINPLSLYNNGYSTTIHQEVDILTSMSPKMKSTRGLKKLYAITIKFQSIKPFFI